MLWAPWMIVRQQNAQTPFFVCLLRVNSIQRPMYSGVWLPQVWLLISSRWCLKSQTTRRFVQELVRVDYTESINDLYYWPFVKGMYCWSVVSPHIGPVMRKKNQYHYVMSSYFIGYNDWPSAWTFIWCSHALFRPINHYDRYVILWPTWMT